MVILASEDIGLADPQALLIAEAAARAVEYVGLPEAAPQKKKTKGARTRVSWPGGW